MRWKVFVNEYACHYPFLLPSQRTNNFYHVIVELLLLWRYSYNHYQYKSLIAAYGNFEIHQIHNNYDYHHKYKYFDLFGGFSIIHITPTDARHSNVCLCSSYHELMSHLIRWENMTQKVLLCRKRQAMETRQKPEDREREREFVVIEYVCVCVCAKHAMEHTYTQFMR